MTMLALNLVMVLAVVVAVVGAFSIRIDQVMLRGTTSGLVFSPSRV